jgi:DNA (cytosine-5)-methyltransferase 1
MATATQTRRHAAQTAGFFDELLVDEFAGGGGASLGIEMATGRAVDLAVNHDPNAIMMHNANHPNTRHECQSVWDVNPVEACGGKPVGLAWFSPDCKHFSKAKGGKPVSKKIRGLAWIVVKWATKVQPRVICLENVEEFLTWGPLLPNDKPDPARKGETFQVWKSQLEKLGYVVEWRILKACDYGAPTIRKRLFLVARCDGKPIVWPEPTHGNPKAKGFNKATKLKPWRTAAECIDFDAPCPSIFTRPRPLKSATCRRIAAGIKRYVIETGDPFLIEYHSTFTGGQDRTRPVDEPLATQDTSNRFGFVVPDLVAQNIVRIGQTGGNGLYSNPVTYPLTTPTTKAEHLLVASHLTKFYGTCEAGVPVDQPGPTVTADGQHLGHVAAFLQKYYGNEKDGVSLSEPMHTVPTKDRFGYVASMLVKASETFPPGFWTVWQFLADHLGPDAPPPVVWVKGEMYVIVDIGMRMLTPRELARAQGFPDSYILTGTKTNQVARIGNSVCPVMAKVIVQANFTDQRPTHISNRRVA